MHDRKNNHRVNSLAEQLTRGIGYQSSGDLASARRIFQKVLQMDADNADAFHLLGLISLQEGDAQEAVRLIHKAVTKYPHNAFYHNSLGNAFKTCGDTPNAETAYLQAVALNSGLADAHMNLGLLYKKQMSFEKAVGCYQKVIAIDPAKAQAYNNMGTAFRAMGDLPKAVSCYQKAVQLSPSYAEAMFNLGNAFQKQGQMEASVDCYKKVLSLNPCFTMAFQNLGIAYQSMGKIEKAVECFKKVIAQAPENARAHAYLLQQYMHLCFWDQIEAIGRKLDGLTREALADNKVPAEPPFLNISRHADPALNHAVAKAWSRDIQKRMSTFGRDKRKWSPGGSEKRLVIGYFSNNFRNHASAHLLRGMFRLHDRSQFKILCYSWGKSDGSLYRNQFENDSDGLTDMEAMSHIQAADCIRQDGVQILIDLVGHTKGNRLEIAALRPAPVQVRWLGLAGPTGADFFDYLITDEIVTPIAHDRFYSEKFVLMPHTYQVNANDLELEKTNMSRKMMGLPDDAIVFCSFCANYKIEREVFDAWMNILARVRNSVLWILPQTRTVQNRLSEAAREKGISPKRIVYAAKMDKEQHLARLQLADIALDTRTVNGAATTSDALRANLPVIALKGKHFASRMSSSILGAVGLKELIAANLETYEDLAVSIATRRTELHRLRRKLRENIVSQPLFDTARFVQNLEKAFRIMWQTYGSGKQPQHIHVSDNRF